jgi:hypothetical protein
MLLFTCIIVHSCVSQHIRKTAVLFHFETVRASCLVTKITRITFAFTSGTIISTNRLLIRNGLHTVFTRTDATDGETSVHNILYMEYV